MSEVPRDRNGKGHRAARRRERLPGFVANALMVLVTAFWAVWSFGEMYHEGWWGPWYNRLPYLIPGAACLLFTLLALTWPRFGGWLLVAVGGLFSLWWWGEDLLEGTLSLRRFLSQFPLSGSLVLIGVLFLLEARARKRREARGDVAPPRPWWYLIALGVPLAIAIGFSAVMLPVVLTRVDDGERGARRIAGNGVTLVWAPQGPGWNWRQPWGGYPSWQRVALYGVPPVGLGDKSGYDGRYATQAEMAEHNLCRYLSADGLTLMDTPQDVWHMPTVDEYVRSFARHGENAGCAWRGEFGEPVDCAIRPDKETPLWAPDQPPVYYWAFEERSADLAYFVSYNGFVNATRKTSGNPRHSYRCAREP